MRASAAGLLVVCLAIWAPAPARAQAAREEAMRAQEEKVLREQQRRAEQQRAAAAGAAAGARRIKESKQAETAVADAIAGLAGRLAGPPAASVVEVNAQYTIVTGGKNVGVTPGAALRCFSRGAPIVVDGETLGNSETLIGAATVKEVRDKLTFVVVDPAAAAPAKVGDVCYGGRDLGKTALLPLLHKGQRTELGNHIAERFYQALSERGVSLVERGQLTSLLAEQKLGDSALFDPKNAAHIGSLAGADSLLLGTIDDTTDSILLVVRIVRARDSVVVASQQAQLPKNETSLAMLKPAAGAPDAIMGTANKAAAGLTLDNPAAEAQKQAALATRLIEAGQLDEALPHFSEAARLAPDLAAVKTLASRLRKAPAKNAPVALKRAEAFITAGRLDDAAQAFVEAVRLNPNLPEVQKVAEDLRKATDAWDSDIRDTHVRRHKTKARAMLKQGQYDVADLDVAAGAALSPGDTEIQALAGDVAQHNPTHHLTDSVLELFGEP